MFVTVSYTYTIFVSQKTCTNQNILVISVYVMLCKMKAKKYTFEEDIKEKSK